LDGDRAGFDFGDNAAGIFCQHQPGECQCDRQPAHSTTYHTSLSLEQTRCGGLPTRGSGPARIPGILCGIPRRGLFLRRTDHEGSWKAPAARQDAGRSGMEALRGGSVLLLLEATEADADLDLGALVALVRDRGEHVRYLDGCLEFVESQFDFFLILEGHAN